MNDHFVIPVSEDIEITNTNDWPLLLKGFGNMYIKTNLFTPLPCGYSPLKRPISNLIKYGLIFLNKPHNISSYEIASWVKKIFQIKRIAQSGTLDPHTSGLVILGLENSSKLIYITQKQKKEYISLIHMSEIQDQIDLSSIKYAISTLTGPIYQTIPQFSTNSESKNNLQIRRIFINELLDVDHKRNNILLRIICESGTYIRKIAENIGYLIGNPSFLCENHRIRIGQFSQDFCVTYHDIEDSKWLYDTVTDESYIRRVIRPLEFLLTHYRRIIVKDTAIDALCHGARLQMAGVMRFDKDISKGDLIIIISTKGEAIGLAISQMSWEEIIMQSTGSVAYMKKVVMERGTYSKAWGKGPISTQRRKMIREGILDKNGKPIGNTPKSWLRSFLNNVLR